VIISVWQRTSVLSASRVPFAIASRQLPPIFARCIDDAHPVSIIVTTALMLVLTLKSSFVAALTISTIARLVAYGVTCAALPVLRRRSEAPPAHFRLHGGVVIAMAALVLAAWLLTSNVINDWIAGKRWWAFEGVQAAIAGIVGLLIYLGYRVYRGRAS
jgi:amino acid transporter